MGHRSGRYRNFDLRHKKALKTNGFQSLLARPKEFESPTFRLGGGRSILLSYGRI